MLEWEYFLDEKKLWVFAFASIIFIITKNPQKKTTSQWREGRGFDQLRHNSKLKQTKKLAINYRFRAFR